MASTSAGFTAPRTTDTTAGVIVNDAQLPTAPSKPIPPLYLGAGLLYFYPLLGTSPGASAMAPFAKVVSLFLMMVPETMVGFAIYMAGGGLYPFYTAVDDRPWGPSTALDDQRLGGALMWSSAMLFDAIWISVAVWGWLRAEEHKAKRVDAQIAAEQLAARG